MFQELLPYRPHLSLVFQDQVPRRVCRIFTPITDQNVIHVPFLIIIALQMNYLDKFQGALVPVRRASEDSECEASERSTTSFPH